MAQYPCSICGQRYRGPQQTMYVAFLNGSASVREKSRMCPDCMDAADSHIAKYWLPAEIEGEWAKCAVCGSAQPQLACFVTAYPAHAERQDWFSSLCSTCCLAQAVPVLLGAGRAVEATVLLKSGKEPAPD